jgi:TetR/AcrR family transcriptional regulator
MQPACQFDHMDKYRVRASNRARTDAMTSSNGAQTAGGKAAPRTGQAGGAGVKDKRGAVLDAALALFSRFGLHGTSVDQVAAGAGVSKSNLLYYFATKEELYLCVLHDLLAVWLAPLREFSAEQDPQQVIGDYIRRKLALSRDRPEASRLFCLEIIQGAPLLRDELARELRELVEHKATVIRAWIAAGRLAPVDPQHLLFLLWATTQHYADFAVQVQALSGRTLDEPAFFEETVASVQAIVLRGVGPR